MKITETVSSKRLRFRFHALPVIHTRVLNIYFAKRAACIVERYNLLCSHFVNS